MAESSQHRLGRIRPPRVNITYDVEVGDAIERKELPFVMGVLGDFTGQPVEPLEKLKDRKFVEENKLSEEEGGKIGVDLKFESLEDFQPDRVAQQVEPLKKLLDLRTQLADLRGSLQGNEKLEEILQETLTDEEKRAKLKAELDAQGGEDG
jgi:type VI secretion system protein ImpB